MTSKVIQGHIRPLLCQNQDPFFFIKFKYDLKCHFYVIEKFCDNFCPYLGAIEIDNS